MNVYRRLDQQDVLEIIVEHYRRRGMNLADASVVFEVPEDPKDTKISFAAWLVVPPAKDEP